MRKIINGKKKVREMRKEKKETEKDGRMNGLEILFYKQSPAIQPFIHFMMHYNFFFRSSFWRFSNIFRLEYDYVNIISFLCFFFFTTLLCRSLPGKEKKTKTKKTNWSFWFEVFHVSIIHFFFSLKQKKKKKNHIGKCKGEKHCNQIKFA